MRKSLNPMPQLRQLIAMNLTRIVIDLNQCSSAWHYGIKNELKYAGYVPSQEIGMKIMYIKKEALIS